MSLALPAPPPRVRACCLAVLLWIRPVVNTLLVICPVASPSKKPSCKLVFFVENSRACLCFRFERIQLLAGPADIFQLFDLVTKKLHTNGLVFHGTQTVIFMVHTGFVSIPGNHVEFMKCSYSEYGCITNCLPHFLGGGGGGGAMVCHSQNFRRSKSAKLTTRTMWLPPAHQVLFLWLCPGH